MPLNGVLQLLELSAHTGVLVIDHDRDSQSKCVSRDGMILNATKWPLRGLEAAIDWGGLKSGRFSFDVRQIDDSPARATPNKLHEARTLAP